MKKIGILFDDRKLDAFDLSYPILGNPGMGGTEYCFSILMYYCAEYLKQFQIVALHYNTKIKFRDDLECVILKENDWESISRCELDMLVIRAGFYENSSLLEYAEKNRISIIAWAHNYLSIDAAEKLAKVSCVKQVVFVSRYMYEHYIDHDIFEKARFIYNFVSVCSEKNRVRAYEPIVVYTGSIIPMKGFHLIAREWKKIIKAVPDAKLYVIGNGLLYSNDVKIGKYGVADERYERWFMHYLLSETGEILDSVHFLGKLGNEKNDIYRKAAVGIINPSGRSETFGLSAVEMESEGLPIVTYDKASFGDIIEKDKSGYLCSTRKEFRKYIIKLLKNQKLNLQMGDYARRFVKEKFDSKKLIKEWEKLFYFVAEDKQGVTFEQKKDKVSSQVRLLNSRIRKKISFIPSLIWVDTFRDFCFRIEEKLMKILIIFHKY